MSQKLSSIKPTAPVMTPLAFLASTDNHPELDHTSVFSSLFAASRSNWFLSSPAESTARTKTRTNTPEPSKPKQHTGIHENYEAKNKKKNTKKAQFYFNWLFLQENAPCSWLCKHGALNRHSEWKINHRKAVSFFCGLNRTGSSLRCHTFDKEEKPAYFPNKVSGAPPAEGQRTLSRISIQQQIPSEKNNSRINHIPPLSLVWNPLEEQRGGRRVSHIHDCWCHQDNEVQLPLCWYD